jgi:uncharacterized protein YbaR (Trm112 family)
MSADARKNQSLNEWIDRLACPACLGALRVEDTQIACTSCGRIYPVVDGIPILIAQNNDAAAAH